MRTKIVLVASALVVPAALGVTTSSAHARAATPTCQGHRATIVGTPGHDTLHGTAGPDVIVGLAGADVIDGRAGHDLICGGSGRDTIDGGAGHDSVHGQAGDDTLVGGGGSDHLIGNKGSLTSFVAGPGDDVMSSRSNVNQVDYLKSPSGLDVDLPDRTVTGWGTDTLNFARSGTMILGSHHDDTMTGTPQQEVLEGEGGVDTIDGGDGSDFLSADGGTVVGGAGSDSIFATGPSTLSLDLDGGPGDDTLRSQNPGHVVGGPGDDEIDWESDPHPFPPGLVLDGGEGKDQLFLPAESTQDYTVSFDMGTGSLTVNGVAVTATAFEHFEGQLGGLSTASTYDVTGTNGPDLIRIIGNMSSTIHALGGDDQIDGTYSDDLIDGGTGDDTADADTGTDTCISIEHATSCETVSP